MRIRFRALDFGQTAKQISFAQIEIGFLCKVGCGDGARVIGLFARVVHSAVRYLDSEKKSLRQPTTTAAVSSAAKRRAECTYFGRGLRHPSLH